MQLPTLFSLFAMVTSLPVIPAKRYFTIGEVAELCDVKPHVLRYWEQEFTQLRPMKRRGNRRYYQHHEVLMIRRIRELLYERGFTISGARNQLRERGASGQFVQPEVSEASLSLLPSQGLGLSLKSAAASMTLEQVRVELLQIRGLLNFDL